MQNLKANDLRWLLNCQMEMPMLMLRRWLMGIGVGQFGTQINRL